MICHNGSEKIYRDLWISGVITYRSILSSQIVSPSYPISHCHVKYNPAEQKGQEEDYSVPLVVATMTLLEYEQELSVVKEEGRKFVDK